MFNARSDNDEQYQLKPRWTVPKRARVGSEDLHISSFVLVVNPKDSSVLFLRAGEKYPVQFRRGKLLLPAAIVDFGESPRKVGHEVLERQLSGVEPVKLKFRSLQSYLGAHWDIVLVFEADLAETAGQEIKPKDPFTAIEFHKLDSLPRDQIASDHLEVLDELAKEETEE
jgi:hypothetical protein